MDDKFWSILIVSITILFFFLIVCAVVGSLNGELDLESVPTPVSQYDRSPVGIIFTGDGVSFGVRMGDSPFGFSFDDGSVGLMP